MEQQPLTVLLERYMSGDAGPEELRELSALITNEETASSVREAMKALLSKMEADRPYDVIRFEPILQKALAADVSEGPGQRRTGKLIGLPIRRWALTAAAVLALLAGVGYWWSKQQHGIHQMTAVQGSGDIHPGGNHARLILSDGTPVILDSMGNGQSYLQGDMKVIKLDSGLLSYRFSGAAGGDRQGDDQQMNGQQKDDQHTLPAYNTVSTPRGGQYRLVLPDGTAVWLNASSSLRFPLAFSGRQRKVELTGEAYFEVATDRGRPFIVHTETAAVQVLGTRFDLEAYTDEPMVKATLLDGAVKVVAGEGQQLLKPGQQASVGDGATIRLADKVDLDEVMAWKNGQFIFKSQELGPIMRQISRWYDVDIIFQGAVPGGHFSGIVSRNSNISQVLKVMELADVHFKIEGRKIIVLP